MRKIYSFLAATVATMALSAYSLTAQPVNPPETIEVPQRAFVVDYLKAFDSFINAPERYQENAPLVLRFYEGPDRRKIFNFLSDKLPQMGYISPNKMVHQINNHYPDGLGITYSSEKITLVARRGGLLSKTFVFKVPVEYSGIRNDRFMISYSGEQYFYIKSKAQGAVATMAISRISDNTYFKTKFSKKGYVTGILVEPKFSLGITTSTGGVISSYGGLGTDNSQYLIFYSTASGTPYAGRNMGVDVIYMFTPNLGFGTGLSHFYHSTNWLYDLVNYWAFNVMNGNSSVGGYTKDVATKGLEKRVTVSSPVAIPVFFRFQAGGRLVRWGVDAGFTTTVVKPTLRSYLNGEVLYRGATFDGLSVTFTSNPLLGFGSFNYNNQLVHQHQSTKNAMTLFGRLNFRINVSKNLYFLLSGQATYINHVGYRESWQMFDAYALRLPEANRLDAFWINFSTQLGFGFNLVPILIGYRSYE